MVREFAKLVRNHYSTKSKFQSPQDFRKSLKNIASYLCDGDQHDSHELMVFSFFLWSFLEFRITRIRRRIK